MSALIYCPFPDRESADAVATLLLDEGLIGCVNVGPAISALFQWNGERGAGEEIPALFKTHADLLERAIARLEDLHPYEAPAILGWPCIAGGAANRWLAGLGGNADDSSR